jgi:hypothetical protein
MTSPLFVSELRNALENVQANPIDARDRPEAWRAQSYLLDLLATLPADAALVTPDQLTRALTRIAYGNDPDFDPQYPLDTGDFGNGDQTPAEFAAAILTSIAAEEVGA